MAKKHTLRTVTPSASKDAKWDPIDQLVSAYDELRKQNGGKLVSNDQLNNAYIQKSSTNASSADFVTNARRSTAEAQQAKKTIAKTGYDRNYQNGAEDYTNAITGKYESARSSAIAKLRKAGTSTGIIAAGDIGAAATAMQKKATGRTGTHATGKSSLKVEIEDQSTKSKIPWTQPVTASSVKYRDSATKMAEDNAKWANRAVQEAEKSKQKAEDKKDVAAYREAVEQYQKAVAAYADSESKVMQNENAMREQANYVRRHASEEQGDALKSERSNMLSDASMAKDTSTIYSEEDQRRFLRAAKDADSRSQRLQEFSQINDYYAAPESRIYDMSEEDFQDVYESYNLLKAQAQNSEAQARAYRVMADKYIKSDQSKYKAYTDKAKSYQAMADSARAKMTGITGGDDKVSYALETRGGLVQLIRAAKKDKNFDRYVELGAKSDWKPKLQNSFESMLNQIGYTNSSDDLLSAMTEEQRDTLYYYLGRGDEDSAQKYFSALEPTLASARMSKARDEMSELTEAHPVFGTAANAFVSTASVPLRLGSVADNAVKAVRNGINSNNPSYTYQPYATDTLLDAPAVMNEGVQLGLGQKLQNAFGMDESNANFLAGTIVSMANNAMQFGAAGGGANLSWASLRSAIAQKGGSETAKVAAKEAVEQAAAGINQWLPLTLMSTNAGVDTIREQLESGTDFGRAFLYGALCGGVEAWTEKIGVDSWVELATKGVETGLLKGAWNAAGKIDRAKLQNLVKTAVGLGNQALSEGGEEVISNVVDTILDVAINGEDSEFMQYRDSLIAQGYSAQEAERKATLQFYVKNSGESFAGGALSGLVFGAFNIPANLQSDNYIGQSIIDNGTDLDLVNAGLEYGTDTEVYGLASQIANKLDSKDGYQTTAKEITRLSVAMSNASKNTAAASMTEQQLKDGGGSQLSTFASDLKATGAISGREAIAANTVMAKALDGETLTAADIKALHADIPAVREVLSQKLGTTIQTGSADEVRSAINQYVKAGNSAKTQAEGQAKARDIVKDAIPYAKHAVLEDTQSEISKVRQSAEAQAQSALDAENATFDSAVADQAAITASRISEAADQQVSEQKAQSSRDARGNLNYKEFSEEYRASHPQAGNTEITKAYDKANREFKSKDTISVDGQEFTRDEFKELMKVRGVKVSNADVDQMFAASIASEQSKGEKPHYSLSTLEDRLERKTVSTEATAEVKADTKKASAGEGSNTSGRRYKLNESFANELDAWDGNPQTAFNIGTTSDALKSIGVEDRNIIWRGNKINKIVKKHPGMTIDVIKQVPNILEKPIVVLKSQTVETRVSMFGEVYDKNGVPVTAILDLEPSSNGGHLVDMYIVNSAYGKDADLKGFVERSDVLYLDTEKNRANHWLQRLGLKLPLHAVKEGSMGSVTYSDGKVNISGTPWSDLVGGAENLNQSEGSNAADTKLDTLDTGKDTKTVPVENSPAPSGKYDENHPNRIAQWLVKEAQSALNAMGVQNAEISVDYSMDKNSNGYYVVKDGKRHIVLNGQLGGTTRNGQLYSAQQNIRFVLAHEIGHIAQGVGYTGETNLYTDKIIRMYEDVTGTTPNEVESGVREIMIQYMDEADRNGNSLGISRDDVTMDYAKGEYAANCLAEMLGNYNTLREIAKGQNRNLIQKAINKLERFQSKLITDRRRESRIKQNMAAQIRGDTTPNAASSATDWVAVAGLYDEAAENLVKMLRDSMKNAGKMKFSRDANTSMHAELGRSIDKYITPDSIKRQIEQVVEMKPVAELSGNEFQKDPNKSLDKMMHEFFNELGNSVETKTLGRVILDDAGIGSDMGHGVFSRKSAAIAAIPDVLGQGEIIDYQSNWKDRPYETVCIAAPVTLKGKLYYEGVIVRRLNYGDSFYTHDVLLAEAAEKVKDGALPQKTGSSEERVIARSKTPSIASLLLKVSEVKYQSEKSQNDSPARYSLNTTSDETDLPGMDEDNTSKFSQFTDTYEKGTKLVSKPASVMAAAVLTQEYGSNSSVQSIATKYRQMSTVAEQLENVYLDGMMGEETIGRDNASGVYEKTYGQLMELGREVADEIIDGATVNEQGDGTVYEYLKDRLRGEKIYVPDEIKQDAAKALQCDTWGEARRKYFGILSNTVNDASKGIEIDSLYGAIREEFPGAIRGDVLSRADQLSAIIDAYNSARDSQSVEYNPLARNITERSDNREQIAQDVVSRMETLARQHATEQFNEYSAAKKSEAARLERQAAHQERQAKAEQSEGKSGEAVQKRADALKEQAAEAKLMSQTDEETVLESVHDEGLGGEKAERRLEQSILSPEVLEWAKHSKELDRVVARMLDMQKRNKQKVSQVRSNTFANSEFFTEAELALDGMRPGDFTYKVKPEVESFGEAASRLVGKVKDKLQSQNDQEAQKVTLDRGEYEHQKQDLKEAAGRLDDNYLHWYETLQSKDHWTGVDLDTAMMILNQIRTNDRAIGDYRESSKWAKMIQERGTEGGQFIQSFAKWSRTTDGMIAKATQELDDQHLGREVNGKAIQRLNEENQQTSEQITVETQKNDALRKENDELLKEREHLREELKKAREINRNAGKENDNLYDKIDNDIEKILRITKEIQEKDGENIRLQDIVDVLDGKVRDRLAKVSQLGTENTQIVADRDRLTAQLEGLEQQNSQLETMIAAGQKEVEMLKAAIDAMKQKNGAQEISLTELTQELQDVLDGLKADCEDTVRQKGVLQKILQGLSRTKDPAKIRELVTKTTNQKLNDRWGRLMGDLLDNVASGKKARIINDMTRIADMINAAESWQIAANAGDKTAELKMRNQLIDCIMDAAKTRGMKPSRKVEEWMRKNFGAQDTAYLNKFARTSLANIADDYQGSSAGQKLSTWQYLAQLLNFRTAARNVVSNAAFQGIDTVARNGGVWLDVLTSKVTGNRTIDYSLRHGTDTSAWVGAKDRAGRAMLEVMLDVDTESGNARSKYGESARRTYKMAQQGIAGALSRTMSRLEMINGISLNVTDEFFKGAIYQGTINANAKLVAEGKMTMEESIQFATEDMLYRTFQDDTLVGSLLNGLHDLGNRVGVGSERAKANGTYKEHGSYVHDFGFGDIICKYRGVPGALVTRAVEFSPMGYLKAIYNMGKLVKSGGMDTHAQRNFALSASRATTGSGLVALFAWLCANGLLKREEDEDDKNVAALDRAEGLGGTQLNLSTIKRLILGEENATEWQNGDELTDIGFLDPLSSTMTMGAMIAKAMKEDGSPFLAALAGAQGGMTAAAFSDLSMMDTINDMVYTIVYHDEQSDLPILADVGASIATSAITGFEPSLLRQLAQASDNHYRDVYGGGAVEDWINKNIPGKSDTAAAIQKGLNSIAVNLPGLRQTVPTKLDPMGNEKVYSPSGNVGRNIANAFFNPGKNSVYTVGSVSEELGRVRRLTGETGFYPDRNAPNSISFGSDYGNEKVKLTDAQKRQYVLDAGNMFESLAAETMKTDAYKDATNDEKAELLQDVKSYAAYKAKQQLYENLHVRDKGYTPYVNDDWGKTEAGMEAGIKFGEMRKILSDTSERKMPSDYDENGETISGSREGKILDYINDLEYEDDQKLNLYGIIRGSGSESSVEKMQNVMDAGLSFYEASKVRKEFNAINDKPHTINDSDMNNHDYFNKWLNDEGYSESEIETINENYKFYTQIRQETDSILKRLTENGMDYDSAYEIANKVAAIEPEDDEDEVALSQKYDVILDDYNMSTGEKQAAIAAIAGTKSVFGDLDEGAAQTMMNLFSQTGQTSAISANAGTSYTVDGTKYDYTEDQQEAYNQAYIGILNNISGASVSSVKTMEDIRDIAANAGKYAALQQAGLNPDLDSSDYGAYRKAQQAMNTGLDLATYCEIKSTCNSFSADKDSNGKSISGSKKKKVVAYLKSQGLSTQQYNFFYNTIMGYK